MTKLLMLSVLAAVIAIPTLCARAKDPRRGVKRAVVLLALFNFLYLWIVLFITPHP